MRNVIYQVYTNLTLDIREVEYLKKTDSFYWNEFGRESLDTKYVKSFDKREDAINYLRYKLESAIRNAQSTAEYYKREIDKFNTLYNL